MKAPALLGLAAAAAALVLASSAQADDLKEFALSIKGAVFTPAEIRVPANTPFVIRMKNENAAPVELEAKDLKIEKVAAGNSEIVVRVKAVKPGTYLFVDEFQEDVAKGHVIAE